MPIADRTDSLDAATAESQASLDTMEAEAAEFFAARSATQANPAPLNPVAPALEKATVAPKKPAAAPPKVEAPTKPTGKVPGAPILKKPEAKVEAPTDTNKTGAQDANADFSDVPREYKPGEMRGKNWDRLHAKSDHFEQLATARAQEVEAMRAELEAARAAAQNAAPSADITTRLTTLQQERDALQARLEAVAVEKSPRFEAQFKPRQQAALAQAKQAVGPEAAAKIEQLLSLGESSYRDNAIEELLSTLPPLRATKLTQAVADLDRLTAERASMASQSGELYKQWLSEENSARERANAERIAKASSTFDAELKEWEPVGLTADDVAAARSVYSGQGATLQDASRAALWAVAGPKVAAQLQEALNRQAELESELSKLRGAQPGVGAAAAGALPSGADDDDDPTTTSYADRIAKQFLRQGGRFGQ